MKEINDINQYAGRGRPRVENPLTPAERAKAYRDRKREADMVKSDAVTVTENLDKLPTYGMLESRIILLTAENLQLVKKLQETQRAEENRTVALTIAHSQIRQLLEKIIHLESKASKPKRAQK
jgi:hypothetical protein